MSGLAGGPLTADLLEEMAALLGRGEQAFDVPPAGPAFAVVSNEDAAAHVGAAPAVSPHTVTPHTSTPHASTVPGGPLRLAVAADDAVTVQLPLAPDVAPSLLTRIAAAYTADPRGFAARLDGRFALAIHDPARDRLLLACDRSGAKTIFWTQFAGGLYFATSLKALLAIPGVERRLDDLALDEFLAQGFTGGTRTLLAGIHRLPPGHELVHERGSVTVRASAAAPGASDGDPVAELGALLSGSVRARLAADPAAGCFLNGSVGSSLVLALLRDSGAGRVQTFAVDWADGDREAARRIAHAFDTDHHELEMSAPSSLDLIELTWLLDLPISTPSVYATYALSALAREHVGRVFSGQGASQLFGRRPGCVAPSAPLAGLTALLARLPGFRHLRDTPAHPAAEPPLFDGPGRHALYALDLRGRLARRVAQAHDGPDEELPLTSTPGTLRGTKPLKLGRATRAQRVDLELPYLDPRVVDWAARLADSPRELLPRDALRDLARRLLPDWVVDGEGRKRSLPIAAWLRGPLSSFAGVLLGEAYVRQQGLFDPDAVSRLCAAVRTGGARVAAQVWRLLAFQLWFLIFLEDEPRARELISRARQTDRIPIRSGTPMPPVRP